jgi:hypothetical protein
MMVPQSPLTSHHCYRISASPIWRCGSSAPASCVHGVTKKRVGKWLGLGHRTIDCGPAISVGLASHSATTSRTNTDNQP